MSSSEEAYKRIIQNRIDDINRQISYLSSVKRHFYNSSSIELKIRSLQREIIILGEELKNPNLRIKLSFGEGIIDSLDKASVDANAEIAKCEARIQALKNVRNMLITENAKRRVDIQIQQQQKLIEKARKGQIRIQNEQRYIMFPKYRRDLKRLNLRVQAEQRILYNKEKLNDAEYMVKYYEKKSNTEELSFREKFDAIKQGFLSNFYRVCSAPRAEAICNDLWNRNSIVMMKGARPISLAKGLVHKLGDGFKKIVAPNTNINNGPTPTVV